MSGMMIIDDGCGIDIMVIDGGSASGGASNVEKLRSTTLAYNSATPLALFSTGVGDVIDSIEVVVDTAFNGSGAAVSVGISGNTAKYVTTAQVNLAVAGAYRIHPSKAAQGVEALIATFTAGSGATQGSARIITRYGTPA